MIVLFNVGEGCREMSHTVTCFFNGIVECFFLLGMKGYTFHGIVLKPRQFEVKFGPVLEWR